MKNVPKQATAKSSIQKKVRPRKAGGKKLSQKCKTDSKKCVLSIRTDNGQSSINPSDGSVEDEASTSPTPFSTNDAMLGNGSDSKDFHENSGVSASATAVKPQNRYILFVGNLPYGATAAAIQKFFKSQDVIGVRLLSSKDTKKPRGCAFVEFSSAAGYKAGLAFHRQLLDGRRIRVERTAGGGGKSAQRVDKIKKRNSSLKRARKASWKARTAKNTPLTE